MNIVVCVKQVVDTEALVELDEAGEVIFEGQTQIIDPYGEFAVERAVQLTEEHGGEVCCVCVGDEGCTSVLRHALAMGAHRAMLVEDAAWRTRDAAEVAGALSEVIAELGPDMTMGGWMSGDTSSAQVMGRIAARLSAPFANVAVAVEPIGGQSDAGAGWRVTCEVDDGVEVADYARGVVVGVQQGLAEPRYPSVRDVMQARRKPIERSSVSGAVNPAARVVERALAPTRAGGRIIEGACAEACVEVARLLRDEAKVI